VVAESKVFFKVEQQFCGECSLALRRFIGGMDGVSAVDVENGSVAVEFDERRLEEEKVRRLTRDSIERLGHRVDEA
jgi:copper chaperone CopZ